MQIHLMLYFWLISLILNIATALATTLTVSVPVADVRSQDPTTQEITTFVDQENLPDKSYFYADNKFQETQVLLGDTLNIIKESGEWAFVELPQQKRVNESNDLVPCQGWINKKATMGLESVQRSNLVVKTMWAPLMIKAAQNDEVLNISIGTMLSGEKLNDGTWEVILPFGKGKINDAFVQKIKNRRESIKDIRVDAVERTKQFLTSPYIWGGTSAHKKFYPEKQIPSQLSTQVSGVDCSGLVYIAFKSLGLTCPRNSNDQYLFSEKIESGEALKPGDLIFFAKVAPEGKTQQRVNHVAIYAGQDDDGNSLIIESQGTKEPYGVRLIRSLDYSRLGSKNLSEIKTGDIFEWVDERNKTTNLSLICFGTFLTSQKLKNMRLDFMHN